MDEVGDIIAESVCGFINSEFGKTTIDRLLDVGVDMTAEIPEEPAGEQLAGKSFVVTGTLTKYTRDEIHDLIQKHGGKKAASVSSKTDFLVAGEKAGSKLAKAEKLGVKIIGEDEFEQLIR